MKKIGKIFSIIFIAIAIISIVVVNILIKIYEQETTSAYLSGQPKMQSMQRPGTRGPGQQGDSQDDEYEEEGFVSGPLLY